MSTTNITFVLAVLNKLNLTQNCYSRIREIYPDTPFVISSGGSTDGTKEWLLEMSEKDSYLTIFHDDDRLTFSETYNSGIKMVDTDKLVLIHNDMVIGEGFLEAIERLLEPNMVLSYTTVEPPVFKGHRRPGKVLLDMGSSFEDFDYFSFNEYVQEHKNDDVLYDGAVFFMSGYKKMFENVGFFDGFSFVPCFCEDDDFLIRAKLKGYDLKTCESAIVYHFVSQTSRFSDDFKKDRVVHELSSIRNFIRKWGIPITIFNELRYWEEKTFVYKTFSMGLITRNKKRLMEVEPFFDKIDLGEIPEDYIANEQKRTRYDLRTKFTLTETVDVSVTEISEFTKEDLHTLSRLRLSIPYYEPGEYQLGNMLIEIKKELN
jgi:GT2 family glycosyltransferase